nr:unnamed protein product [Digitaria exilis]
MSTADPPSPASQRRHQCAAATAAAAAACLAPLIVFLAVLVLAPSLVPRLLLRPHYHAVLSVASAELRLMSFDAAASAIAYNLSAVLRFEGPPPSLHARQVIKAAPFYAGQELGAAVALPEFTQRRGGVGRARARERARGRIVVRDGGEESDFACLLSFPVPQERSNGSVVFDGGSCADAVRGEF